MIIVIEGGHEYQVATFRAESGYADGRRPDRVRFTDAREDAMRRDFTINGLFYVPIVGELYDWVGGLADLKARRIRTIGAPERRFGEVWVLERTGNGPGPERVRGVALVLQSLPQGGTRVPETRDTGG